MLRKLKNVIRRFGRPPLHRPTIAREHIVLGSEYGGWPLVSDLVNSSATVFSFGIGEDITFDIAAIRKYGCKVYGFDPTPRSQHWIQAQNLPEAFVFFPVGIGAKDGDAEFFAPANAGHVSYSLTPRDTEAPSQRIFAPILRLETILDKYKLSPPDVLKMDIEGFEYAVLDDILAGSIRPSLILVEFHHGIYSSIEPAQTNNAVEALREAGYELFYVSPGGHEYGFVWIGSGA